MYPNQEQGVPHGEGVPRAPADTVVPPELLEEMLWFFRVEDATPWNISIFVLVGVVVVISMVLLGRSIKANRKQKMLPREKQTPEVLTEANNLNILRETLLSEKLNSVEVDIELKERSMPPAFLPDPQESES